MNYWNPLPSRAHRSGRKNPENTMHAKTWHPTLAKEVWRRGRDLNPRDLERSQAFRGLLRVDSRLEPYVVS